MALPQRGPGEPQNGVLLHDQERVQEEAVVGAVADGAEPARAPGMGLIVELGGVLDDQDMAPGRGLIGQASHGVEHLGRGHTGIGEQAAEALLTGAGCAELSQADGALFEDGTQEVGGPLFRRGSPKSPIQNSSAVMTTSAVRRRP